MDLGLTSRVGIVAAASTLWLLRTFRERREGEFCIRRWMCLIQRQLLPSPQPSKLDSAAEISPLPIPVVPRLTFLIAHSRKTSAPTWTVVR